MRLVNQSEKLNGSGTDRRPWVLTTVYAKHHGGSKRLAILSVLSTVSIGTFPKAVAWEVCGLVYVAAISIK